jgi:hypothetical protein
MKVRFPVSERFFWKKMRIFNSCKIFLNDIFVYIRRRQ